MKDHIRQLLRAEPFHAFTIHLAHGRTVAVNHPDFATATTNPMTMIYVETEDGRIMHIAPDLILSAELTPTTQAA